MSESKSLTHLDESGRARMVDVGDKPVSDRMAAAEGRVVMSREAFQAAVSGDLKKGDLRSVAELAGVMAAKRTADLIPLCHPLQLSHVEVMVEFDDQIPGARVTSRVRTSGQTGVEMEALTAVGVACLTVYDMVKGLDRGCRIANLHLLEKRGGRSGDVLPTSSTHDED